MVADYLWMASGVARVDVTRRVALRELIAVRQRLREPPSWTAMFVKAFAAVAQEIPELRRSYMKWPWPHLYEYGDSTAVVMHERELCLAERVGGEKARPARHRLDVASGSNVGDQRRHLFRHALLRATRVAAGLRAGVARGGERRFASGVGERQVRERHEQHVARFGTLALQPVVTVGDPGLVHVAEVVFPELSRGVALVFEQVGDRDDLRL